MRSPEVRAKISRSMMGNQNRRGKRGTHSGLSLIARVRISEAMRGNQHAKGHTVSAENRKKVAEANRNRKWTPEQKAAIKQKLTGITRSEKTRARMSYAQKKRRKREKEQNR